MTGIDLQKVSAADFEARSGDRFDLEAGDAPEVRLVLSEVARLPAEGREGGAFSALFDGPREPLLDQGTYRLRHADWGALELFLVPIAQTETASRYEAVFA